MIRIAQLLSAGAFALALAASPALAHPPIPERAPADEQAAFQADRADILAMAGDFKVRFDMQESTPWREGYTPIDAKVSGGHESVRVIEDTGRKIVLQHMLVVEQDGQSYVIKHWRQDWEYEPARYLAYSDTNEWSWQPLDERQRHGRWSQTVYQVDDSPRYSSYGEFETQGGIRRWRSNWTWRPLARRDAIRHPVYDRYYGINRHPPTPNGWIHWQDNMKMAQVDGQLQPVVQEYVLNTYTRFSDYDTKAADAYWAATKDYWAAIRAEWDAVAAAKGGIAIQEEAETGTVISARLLEIADEIKDGSMREADGVAEARKLIEDNTQTVLAGG
jgi:hypothetical protein